MIENLIETFARPYLIFAIRKVWKKKKTSHETVNEEK